MHGPLNVKSNSHAHGSRMPLAKPNKTKPLTALLMKHSLYLWVWYVHIFLAQLASQTLTYNELRQSCYKTYKYNFTKLDILNNGLYLL